MNRQPQPAQKKYFFEKGYKDLKNTIKGAWIRNFESILRCRDRISAAAEKGAIRTILSFIQNVFSMFVISVCGTLITVLISTINIIILLVCACAVYIVLLLVWAIDRIYLWKNKIFVACDQCKERSLIPAYICPNCGAKHTKLVPGSYGIFKRTCSGTGGQVCGEKLPATFFNGRQKLAAECPACGNPLTTSNSSIGNETRPICIPVVGGRSVGKTAFITAFSKEFIETVVPSKSWEVEFYNREKAAIYKEIEQDYQTGSTRMTARSNDLNQASAISFSFFLKGRNLKPPRLIHIYDIAGEVFTDNSENEVQKQYEYCQGIVLILDPFSIPEIRYRYEELLEPEDIAGIGNANINSIADTFFNKLREVIGLSDNKLLNIPIAVVINKIDAAGLNQDIGELAVNKLKKKDPEKYKDFYDVQDYLCRKFLIENGMGNFVNGICNKFKNNRFFACSAIGHTRDKGSYMPKGIMAPMEWIFRYVDPKIGKVWRNNEFTKVPFAVNGMPQED